jgi:peptidoglycan/LPS O-acetylase OafA/YrhL
VSPALSLYLDLTRASAALVVLLSHCWLVLFPNLPLHWPGPPAVIVFFVLSGFVIAYVTDGRDRTLAQYALNRLSRLWSVSLPALVLGLVVARFVATSVLAPEPADGAALLRTVANALFLGQSWFLDLSPPFNGPFWSLNYEAWFYAIFGAWMYLPRRAGTLIAVLLAVAAGPKILLMLPCWLLGVWLYRNIGRWRLSERAAAALWAGSLAAALLLIKSALATTLHDAFLAEWPRAAALLAYSGYPLTDYPLAILVAANFYAAAYAHRLGKLFLAFARPIRLFASFTLTIYLFHLPLLVLFHDALHVSGWLCLGAVAASIVVLGYLTEHRRGELRALLARLLRSHTREASATTMPADGTVNPAATAPPTPARSAAPG